VFNLSKLSDFSGNYTSVSAGATVAGGASAADMKNQHGTVIHVHSTNQGLDFNLSLDGVAVRLARTH
jgi:lipid-binding SYLF domain-containing protein